MIRKVFECFNEDVPKPALVPLTVQLQLVLVLAARKLGRELSPQFSRGQNQNQLQLNSQGNKCRFWHIFVEALEDFPNHFIQSKTSASTHECSVSNRVSKYVMLLSNFMDENRGLSPVFVINWYLFPRLETVGLNTTRVSILIIPPARRLLLFPSYIRVMIN